MGPVPNPEPSWPPAAVVSQSSTGEAIPPLGAKAISNRSSCGSSNAGEAAGEAPTSESGISDPLNSWERMSEVGKAMGLRE